MLAITNLTASPIPWKVSGNYKSHPFIICSLVALVAGRAMLKWKSILFSLLAWQFSSPVSCFASR